MNRGGKQLLVDSTRWATELAWWVGHVWAWMAGKQRCRSTDPRCPAADRGGERLDAAPAQPDLQVSVLHPGVLCC